MKRQLFLKVKHASSLTGRLVDLWQVKQAMDQQIEGALVVMWLHYPKSQSPWDLQVTVLVVFKELVLVFGLQKSSPMLELWLMLES